VTRLLPTCLAAPVLVLAVVTTKAQAPTGSAPEHGKQPVIAIDEAHGNTHTFGSAPFRGLVQLLQADGYEVRRLEQKPC
jgi:hypothetical protein